MNIGRHLQHLALTSLAFFALSSAAHTDEVRQFYDKNGHVIAEAHTNGNQTIYYDDKGHPVVTNITSGGKTIYYDSGGHIILSTPEKSAPSYIPAKKE